MSKSDSEDESDELKESERPYFCCFFCSNMSMPINRLFVCNLLLLSYYIINQFKGRLPGYIPDREMSLERLASESLSKPNS